MLTRLHPIPGEKTPGGPASVKTETGPSGQQPAETTRGTPGDRQQYLQGDLPRTGREDRGEGHRRKSRRDGSC